MTLLMDNRNVTMTLWRANGRNVNGSYTYSAPITFTGRYQERQDLFLDAQGRQVTSTTSIYTEELEPIIGDWLVLGESAELSPTSDARQVVNTAQYRFVTNNADVYKAML